MFNRIIIFINQINNGGDIMSYPDEDYMRYMEGILITTITILSILSIIGLIMVIL